MTRILIYVMVPARTREDKSGAVFQSYRMLDEYSSNAESATILQGKSFDNVPVMNYPA